MSFGFGVGDFVAVGNLCWKLYRACKDARGEFQEATSELSSLHAALLQVKEDLTRDDSLLTSADTVTLKHLREISNGCREPLLELEQLVKKHSGLGFKSKRPSPFERLKFPADKVGSIRSKLSFHTNNLDLFLASLGNSALARIERKLDELFREVRAGKRDASTVRSISHNSTIASSTGDDDDELGDLMSQLEEEGISRNDITQNEDFIREYVEKQLEDEVFAPSEDPGSLVSMESDKSRHEFILWRDSVNTAIRPTEHMSGTGSSFPGGDEQMRSKPASIIDTRRYHAYIEDAVDEEDERVLQITSDNALLQDADIVMTEKRWVLVRTVDTRRYHAYVEDVADEEDERVYQATSDGALLDDADTVEKLGPDPTSEIRERESSDPVQSNSRRKVALPKVWVSSAPTRIADSGCEYGTADDSGYCSLDKDIPLRDLKKPQKRKVFKVATLANTTVTAQHTSRPTWRPTSSGWIPRIGSKGTGDVEKSSKIHTWRDQYKSNTRERRPGIMVIK